jgi:hypothetical protein
MLNGCSHAEELTSPLNGWHSLVAKLEQDRSQGSLLFFYPWVNPVPLLELLQRIRVLLWLTKF